MWFHLKASNFLFLLSQSEWLQNWCQPGAAGNWCDQHHGFLCVSLPCHWQLWEVCVSVCFVCESEGSDVYSIYSVVFSPHRTAVNSQTGVCTPAGGIVTSESWHLHCISSALLWWSLFSHIVPSTVISMLPSPTLSPLLRSAVIEDRGRGVKQNT